MDAGCRKKQGIALRTIVVFLLLISQLAYGLGGGAPAFAAEEPGETRTVTVLQAIEEAADWITEQGPVTDDWFAYALSAAGRAVEDGYLEAAKERAEDFNSATLPTSYAKLILGVTAAGENAASFEGVNLLASLYDHNDLTEQGNNALIYSLLAYDSGEYAIPETAAWSREAIVETLLAKQIPNEGWALYDSSEEADIDLTGAALWALAPYKDDPDVAAAVAQAVAWLASKQLDNGDFTEDHVNSNAAAMAVLGLSAQQINGKQGVFANAEGDLLTALFAYMNADGGFSYEADSGSDGFSTYQALIALSSFAALTGGQGGSYEVPVSDGSERDEAKVFIHIEAPDETMAEGFETAATPLEALQSIAARNGLPIETREEPFFDVYRIGDVSKNTTDGYYYWGFNIKRDGQWTDDWNWEDTALEDGDELVVFYGPFGASEMIDRIELIPSAPKNDEPVQVKVTKFSGGISVAAAVYVEIGDESVWTGDDGIAELPQGFGPEDEQISAKGPLVSGFPTVIRGVKRLPPTVDVTVEGPESTLTHSSQRGNTVFEALNNAVTDVVYTEGEYFGIDAVNGIEADGLDWWGFAVYRDGDWIETGGWQTTPVEAGDRVVIYYSTLDTSLVSGVAVAPTVPKAGQTFTVEVTQENWQGTAAAADVDVRIGNVASKTNASGVATFDGGLEEGTYELVVSGYREGAAPKVVRYSTSLNVAAASGDDGSVPPATPTVTLRIDGGEAGGSILPKRKVEYRTGDTPYAVLVREIGAGSVESSGSGSSLYVRTIDGLSEYDHGAQSGWMYSVNCKFPSTSAGSYRLKANDNVVWWYTLDGGNDVKSACNSGGNGSSGSSAPAPLDRLIDELNVKYDNRQPVDPNVRTVTVVNADRPMTAEQLLSLKEALQANTVRVSEEVAPNASEVSLGDAEGEVQLRIPPQGLGQSATLTIEEISNASSPGLVGSMYEFGPSGTVFNKPVYLSIKAPIETTDAASLAMVWLNENTGEWIPIPAVVDMATGTITGVVDHFTKFAIIDKTKWFAEREADLASAVDEAIDGAIAYASQDGAYSDWEAYALAAAGADVPAAYLAGVEALLKSREGSFRNVTDYERIAIGIAAAGGDPSRFAGYNVMERIVENERMTAQGTNGPIFALVALDAAEYEPSPDALWTRDALLDWLIERQNEDGGWPLADGDASNVDLTAMAVVAMAPYAEREDAGRAIDRAVTWLSSVQLDNGGYALGGEETSESAAQVLLALAALGIDPVSDVRFVKPNGNVVSNLLSYRQSDGGFAHAAGQPSGSIPTEQALSALAKYRQFAAADDSIDTATYADASRISPWALEAVEKAQAHGLMEGVGDRRFAPQQPMTRAQFVAVLLRLLGVEPNAGASSGFADVSDDDWFAGYVAKASEMGFVQGTTAATFEPHRSLTRQELATLLARAYELPLDRSAGRTPLVDANAAAPYAVSAIRAVYEAGYMQGDAEGRFHPEQSVTREMAAVVIVRIYERTLSE